MARTLIIENGPREAAVSGTRNAYGEFEVRFYLDKVHQKGADYLTDDRDDAIGTAEHWCRGASVPA